MFGVYTKDPKMRSASDMAQQMKQFYREIDALSQQMNHYNKLLASTRKELDAPFTPINTPPNGTPNGHTSPRMPTVSSTSLPANNNRVSCSEDRVSSDGSAVMGMPRRLNGNKSSIHSPHASNMNMSAEIVSNSNGSHRIANTSSSASRTVGNLYDDPGEHLPPLGKAKAIYPFEEAALGDSTTISMYAGEELQLLKKDDGQSDAWTGVRNPRSGHEGFVPTSYLAIGSEQFR